MTFPDVFLVWIMPPLVGGVIGYITNWLAVKMLFRPLREWRVFGLRVPFTPGVLPRERGRLAVNLGNTVANELLTPEVVRKRLAEPEFRAVVATTIANAARDVLGKPIGSGSDGGNGYGPIRDVATGFLGRVAESEAFKSALGSAISHALGAFKTVKVGDLVGSKDLAGFLADGRGDRLAVRVGERLDARLRGLAEGGRSLADFIDPDAMERLVSPIVDAVYPTFAAEASVYLAEPDVRTSLERTAKDIAAKAIDRLTGFKRFVVKVGGFDATVMDAVPTVVEDLSRAVVSFVRDERNASALKSHLLARARAYLSTPLGAPADDAAKRDDLPGFVSRILAALFATLAEAGRSAGRSAERSSERNPDQDEKDRSASAIAGDGRMTVGDLLSLFGDDVESAALAAAEEKILGAIARTFSSRGTEADRNPLGAFTRAFTEEARGQSLGALLGLDDAFLDWVGVTLSACVSDFLAERVGGILETVDIRSIVVEKINALDMLDVERIVLGVMERELGWITAIGGILGAALGVFQSVFLALNR